jgi:hypothetical protein
MSDNDPKTFAVPEANLPILQERIAKLNKRAAKLNCAPITINVLGSKEVAIKDRSLSGFEVEDNIVGYRKVYELTVTGQAPKINGWEFIAVIQPVLDESGKNMGNILRNVPGASVEVPVQYRTTGNNCDHCHTERRRNETFILHSDQGETKQVGRNCLRDFLGHTSPEVYASIAQMLLDAADFAGDSERDEFGSSRHIDRYVGEEILALAACSIRLNGWRSNKTAREYGTQSTSMEVSAWLFANSNERKKWLKPLRPSDEDKATAKEVTEWMSTLSQRSDLNDYLYNLSIIGQGATFTTKNFGLACSAIPTYLREMEQEINRRKRFQDDQNSQFVGEVGQREKLTLTLVYTRDIEHEGYGYGSPTVTHMYKFKDEAGNVVTWFASNVYFNPQTQQDINVGDTIVVTATIKKHEEYKGVKQTIITRCTQWKSKEQKKAEASERKIEQIVAKTSV